MFKPQVIFTHSADPCYYPYCCYLLSRSYGRDGIAIGIDIPVPDFISGLAERTFHYMKSMYELMPKTYVAWTTLVFYCRHSAMKTLASRLVRATVR